MSGSANREGLGLLRPDWPRLSVAFGCMGLLALTTAAAAELVGPVLHALVMGGAPDDWLGRLLPTDLLRQRPWLLPASVLALGAARGASYFGQFRLVATVGQRTASRLRERVLGSLVRAGPTFLSRQQTGDLLSRLSGDVSAVEMAVTYALAAYVRDTATALLLLALCFILDWKLALIAFGLLPLTIAPLVRLASRLLRLSRRAQTGQGTLGQSFAEDLQGLRLIQVDGLEARERERFRQESRETLRHVLQSARLRAVASPLMEVIAVAGVALALWVASAEVARGDISADHLVSLLAAVLLTAQPVKSLGKVGQFLVTGRAALERLLQIESGAEAAGEEAAVGPAFGSRGPALRGPLLLELQNVWFRYPARSGEEVAPWVLQGLSLRLERGERVALVGRSGSGKSTAVALLLGLYSPERGAILVDGAALRSWPRATRSRLIAWMGQEALLLDLSIAENIALPEPSPDPTRLREAARRAGALELVEAAGGFDAPVGERGGRFSGGERQRLCLARAFYRDAPILVLDEPTSQLDAASEEEIAGTLDRLLEGRTALVVTHRLATARQCHRVAVVHEGRIVEQGRPADLLGEPGRFEALMSGQVRLASQPRLAGEG
ncbi:MAG: ABC transporter ATP-binding protein [Myxococcales bacterium]